MSPRLILGCIVRDEADMLALTLPKLAPHFDGIVAIDAESADDTRPLIEAHGAHLATRPWTAHYADARNACIALAESRFPGAATLLMLDADECMTARDLASLRFAIAGDLLRAWAFPRYEFVDDFYHFNPAFYPDLQARCFPLHTAFRYVGALHEQLCRDADERPAVQTGACHPLPYLHIFHYGKCKPRKNIWLKYENYRRQLAGEPLLSSVPADASLPLSFSHGPRLFFHGERPL